MAQQNEYDKLADRIVEMTEALIRHRKFYRVQAQAARARFDALIDAGFTRDDAIRITALQGTGVDVKGSY